MLVASVVYVTNKKYTGQLGFHLFNPFHAWEFVLPVVVPLKNGLEEIEHI